jgi:glutaredoxin-like protein DUF836
MTVRRHVDSERAPLKLTLLARAYCHLCDEMLAAVSPIADVHGAAVVVLDLDAPANAALDALWGEQVPALFAGDPVPEAFLCRYVLDKERVVAALRGFAKGRVADVNPL